MNIYGFWLVVIGAVFLALFSVESKRQLNLGWSSVPAHFTALTCIFAAGALLIITFGTGGPDIATGWWLPMLVTGILNIGIQFANAKAKALEDVSLVVPISATTPAALVFASMVILGEYPSLIGWLGIWVLALGTYMLNVGAYVERRRAAGERGFALYLAPLLMLGKSRGVRFALLSALLATVSLNFDALACRLANPAFASAIAFMIAGGANLVLSRYSGEKTHSDGPHTLRSVLLLGVFLALAAYWSGLAFRYGIAPYVGALKRLQIPLTIVLAYALVGERLRFRERLLGGSLMAVGVVLIGLS